MIFHSLDYVFFFILVLLLHWQLPRRGQIWLLLGASLYFYGYVSRAWLIPFVFTMVLDYTIARLIEAQPARRRLWLLICITSNTSLLCWFKYRGFFIENIQGVLSNFGLAPAPEVLNLIVPAGISFYTFQSMSYVIDVYRGHMLACRRLDDYALFVSFFPQLVAGPIERAPHLLSQVLTTRTFPWSTATRWLTLILWGFLLKVVIADHSALIANKVFSIRDATFPILWSGVFAFAIQILADFSAYTAIARGSAGLLGFDLMENFRHPYLASSPADFWRRWHISLSTWMRDYIYIPLGGSRGTKARATRNVILTFLISGAWHGAAWNFILWGLYWGLLVAADQAWGKRWRPPPLIAVPFMFALTCIGWLMFREQDAHYLLQHFQLNPWTAPTTDWHIAGFLAAKTLLLATPIILHAWWDLKLRHRHPNWDRLPSQILLSLALFTLILILRSPESSAFIYFQF
jgi:D-alanyl-lipoteichoic acid acyltransferase DltB (MBOAT superfamily)